MNQTANGVAIVSNSAYTPCARCNQWTLYGEWPAHVNSFVSDGKPVACDNCVKLHSLREKTGRRAMPDVGEFVGE